MATPAHGTPFQFSRVLILGASELQRLEQVMDRANIMGVSMNFGFDASADIRVHGIGGRTVEKIQTYDLHLVKPQVVMLCVGGNDLSLPRPLGAPEIVGFSLVELAEQPHDDLFVERVVVAELNPRHFPFCGRDYPMDYNMRVLACNRYLYHTLNDLEYAFLWRHRDVLEWDPSKMFDRSDGVHFSHPTSLKRWYRSLKGSLLNAMK